jgi:hypothetical protein
MYERSYQTGEEQQIRPGAILGASLGPSVTREVPMAESMNRLMSIITFIDEAVTELDQRTHVIRQTGPQNVAKDARPERTYSPLVGTINDQVSRLERLNYALRQITSELEI